MKDFFGFLTCSFFFHFLAFGLRTSGLFVDLFFLFCDLQLLFAFYCFWFKAVGFKLSLTNSRGSRVQSRGRGSNVAVGENDLGFEVTAE